MKGDARLPDFKDIWKTFAKHSNFEIAVRFGVEERFKGVTGKLHPYVHTREVHHSAAKLNGYLQ